MNCETQKEVDEVWESLSRGGTKDRCGWLKDPYGVTWQIVPKVLLKMLRDKNSGKTQSVMKAMLQMDKLDIRKLKRAYQDG